MKICTKCNKEKEISEFTKDKYSKTGYTSHCKSCRNIKNIANRIIRKIQEPWYNSYRASKERCNSSNHIQYKDYGGRGIKNYLTLEQVKKLWFRDKAYNMKKPSIDRKDNDGNYEYGNCQFIELKINSAKEKIKPILQYDLDGTFIKKWKSITSARIIYGDSIKSCLSKKTKKAYGFIWRYIYV